jgi:hypothetical protein
VPEEIEDGEKGWGGILLTLPVLFFPIVFEATLLLADTERLVMPLGRADEPVCLDREVVLGGHSDSPAFSCTSDNLGCLTDPAVLGLAMGPDEAEAGGEVGTG